MLTTLLTLTFDEFVQYGLSQNSNIVDGVPWSFDFQGLPVSHETNDKYLITTPGGVVPFNRYETITYSGSPKSITVFSLGGSAMTYMIESAKNIAPKTTGMFAQLKKLGYCHYTAISVEELDSMDPSSDEWYIETQLAFKWFREKYGAQSWIKSNPNGYATWVIDGLMSGDSPDYLTAVKGCLETLIKVVIPKD